MQLTHLPIVEVTSMPVILLRHLLLVRVMRGRILSLLLEMDVGIFLFLFFFLIWGFSCPTRSFLKSSTAYNILKAGALGICVGHLKGGE